MEKGRDPAMRALNFLIGEVAHQVVGLPVIEDDGRETMLIDWRSDPFVYRAFKLAVQQLLETLTPPGKIESHAASKALAKKMLAGGLESPPFVITLASSAAHDPVTKRFVESWKTPEARAEYAVGWVLDSLRTARSGPDREEARKFAERVNSPSAWREFYGMPDAARDLQPNQPPRRGK